MPGPFDAATKRLLEVQPLAWLEYLGLPGTQATLLDTDLTTVTAEADRVLSVQSAEPYLAHVEFQSTYQTDLDERVLRYNALLHFRDGLPVRSVVLLLRREADGPEVTGRAGYILSEEDGKLDFRYRLVRVWEKSVQSALSGGLATLPLAPLTDVDASALPEVIRRMQERIETEASPEDVGLLWTATYLLMGLKYKRDLIHHLLRGVRDMRESTTYQAILEEGEIKGKLKGKIEEARSTVLRLGTKRFGVPSSQVAAVLASIASLEALEQLTLRLLDVESWDELLA